LPRYDIICSSQDIADKGLERESNNKNPVKKMNYFLSLRAREEPRWKHYSIDTLLAATGALLATAIIYIFQLYPRIPNISLLYLLVVLGLGSIRGRYAAIVASLVAFFSFDFFLVPPLYKFTINKFDEWLALFVFLATAIITGQLTSALRDRAEEASKRESETRSLYELVSATTSEESFEHQLRIVAHTLVDIFASRGILDCAILLPNGKGKLSLQADSCSSSKVTELSSDEANVAMSVLSQGNVVDIHHSSVLPLFALDTKKLAVQKDEASLENAQKHFVRMIPLKIGQRNVGVMRLLIADDPQHVPLGQSLGIERGQQEPRTAFFWTFLDQATSIIERARLHRENLQVELLQRTDALRAALLSSVSHDLRTPLASIKAATSSLLQEDVQWDEESRRSFIVSIEHEADRLNRLVGNLLDMSRIEGGAVKPEKEWYPIDELIHDVLGHMQFILQNRLLHIDLPEDLPPVALDYLQMDQVLTNLIENAVRYTPSDSPIEINAEVVENQLRVSIADRGPGIPPQDKERIFDKFYRVLGVQRKGTIGSGLGLSVCRGLVEAHGGRIWAENRPAGGAVFRFTLPIEKAEEVQRGDA
jgi:two-component system sensor histidine kinase KdpD